MEIKRLRTLVIEIFKTLNDINPDYKKEIFYLSSQELIVVMQQNMTIII